ncbi:glutathione S-transferase family protein [Thalassotalea crassostreae]|uniref:glutathione S-transferase family protein n=1 Tax=Thalassotalea crassostreae TaxID=1763536 RepID=UPI000AB868DF|nr:glutathione S-transferase family protein [Thalassotalea crassostreae]
MTINLWHCHNSRSLRVLWALEEMQLDYQVHSLPFPPRFKDESFLEVNSLGTIPFLKDNNCELTESTAMLLYLAEKYQVNKLRLTINDSEYGDFLNWLFQSDATFTFPLTLVLRYSQFESIERQQPQVVEDYSIWFMARLKRLNEHLLTHKYLCGDKFTIADIAVGYSLYLGKMLGLDQYFKPQTAKYLTRLMARPAFIKANSIGKNIANYEISEISDD